MPLLSCYPVLMVEDVGRASAFFVEHFQFERVFANDWYVSLRHVEPPHAELAFLHPEHDTIPAGFGAPVRGLLINIEVADATSTWASLRDRVPVRLALRDEPFGQRHFIVEAPAGLLVDVIEIIPPSEEYARQFVAPASTPD